MNKANRTKLSQWTSLISNDLRVQAIRADRLIGAGSCSSIDECWTDGDIIGHCEGLNITTPEEAVKELLEEEHLYLMNACEHRWGEDDDIELVTLKRFEAELERRKNER